MRRNNCEEQKKREEACTMVLKFTKMHGLGNDYLYVVGEPNDALQRYGMSAPALSVMLSDRHFGVGSDGMIWVAPSEIADFKMRVFNADGSEAQMCGNGIRCVGKLVHDLGLVTRSELSIETPSGVRSLSLQLERFQVVGATVDMGTVAVSSYRELDAGGLRIAYVPVSVGNPHAVVFVDDAERAEVAKIGPLMERHASFPEGVNVEFVSATGPNALRMRVWERGSGVTMACGTGACASAAAAVGTGLVDAGEPVIVQLDGGDLVVKVMPESEGAEQGKRFRVFMTGPAVTVFCGEVEL